MEQVYFSEELKDSEGFFYLFDYHFYVHSYYDKETTEKILSIVLKDDKFDNNSNKSKRKIFKIYIRDFIEICFVKEVDIPKID